MLVDVDAWTGFSECFTHRRTGCPCDDRPTLLTRLPADGINLGLTRMANTCRGASLRRLALVHDWHISEAAYAEALGRPIDAHRALPLAGAWGDGTTSSSDGQGFFAGGRARRSPTSTRVAATSRACASTPTSPTSTAPSAPR